MNMNLVYFKFSIISRLCFCLLFLILASCGDDNDRTPASSTVKIIGLENEKKAKQFQDWTWSCQENNKKASCTYRYAVNDKSAHTFDANVKYQNKATATTKGLNLKDGKYYIHVEGKSVSSERRSSVTSASVTLDNTPPEDPVSSSFEAPDSSDKATIEITVESVSAGDQVKIYVEGGSNNRSSFLENIISFFSQRNVDSDICVEENEVGSGTVSSGKTEITIDVNTRVGEHNYYATVTDEAGNPSACVQAFTYSNTSTTTTPPVSTPGDVQVTGLAHDTDAGNSKTWSWGCNKSSCTYRYVINQSSSHTFRSSDSYGSTTRATKGITSSSQNGTYYIHVQARDSDGNVSEVKSVLAILNISTSGDVRVTGLAHDTSPKASKTWSWGCNKSSCTYRYVINQSRTHTFRSSDSYGSARTATKSISSSSEDGTYYIHVQARDSSGNVSEVKSVLVTLRTEITTSDVLVTGLSHDTTPKASKTWRWGCNKSSCTYRYVINQSSSHTFRSSDSYGSARTATKRITSSSEDGTYYIHVQARDSNGNVSGVESVLAILEIEAVSDVQVTGLSHDTSPKASKTWTWGCNKRSCTYRYAINQNSTHTFSSGSYASINTATKRITSSSEDGTYYIHVQARDSNSNESEVESVLAILEVETARSDVQVTGLEHDVDPKASKTWTWDCNKSSCTYRYVINQNSTHTFSSSDSYGSTKTATKSITSSSEDGTYYIHVQARDSDENVSDVTSVLAILRYNNVLTGNLAVTGIVDDRTAGRTKTWRWSCMNNSGTCTYRHVINTDATHTFEDSDTYNTTTTATKTAASNTDNGTYYLHVQAKDASGTQSPVKSVVFYLSFEIILVKNDSDVDLTSPTNPRTSQAWTWKCRNAANNADGASCTYRHVVNTSAAYFFSDDDAFGATATQTISISAGQSSGTTYYLHIQAKDGDGRLSSVVTVFITLTSKLIIVKDPITEKALSKASVKWTWECDTDNSNTEIRATTPCLYRYAIIKDTNSTCDDHTFDNDVDYNSTTTVTKTITNVSEDGDYCLYVQTKDSSNNVSSVKNIHQELTFELLILKDPVAYRADADSFPTKLQLHVDRTPTFTVLGFSPGNRVRLYSSNQCTDGSDDSEGDPTRDTRLSNEVTVPSNNQTDIALHFLDHFRTYPIYVGVRESSSDTSVDCWAATSSSDSTPIAVTNSNKDTVVPLFEYTLYKDIIAEHNHTCHLSPGGDVKCWGRGNEGQLGHGAFTNLKTPPANAIDLDGDGDGATNQVKAKAVAIGQAFTCAILNNDTVKCWGFHSSGQLGVGPPGSGVLTTRPNKPLADPIDLGAGRTAKAITTGGGHVCAILDDDSLKCWGYNVQGQIGQNSEDRRFDTPQAVDLGCEGQTTCSASDKFKAKAVAAGSTHTCVILLDENDTAPDHTGKVLCWGFNAKGQLGQNDKTNRGRDSDKPISRLASVNLGTGRTAKSISGGLNFTCALLDNNTTKCWGHNILGQLGQNNVADRGDETNEMASLGTISLGGSAKSIVTGQQASHACAVLSNDTMKCWGNNWRGQLGQGDRTEYQGANIGKNDDFFFDGRNIINNRNHGSGRGSSVPASSNVGRLARTVSSLPAINFGCNVAIDREGNTPACSSSTNFKLKSPDSVAVGEDHTCAVLKTSQESDENKEFVKCWGSNVNGQLGQGDNSDRGGTAKTAVDKIPAIEFSFGDDDD